MNVKQALKLKAKLLKEISELYHIAISTNSIEVGNIRRFSVANSLKNAMTKTNELVELKGKIHRANISVYNRIFLMAELKGAVNRLKKVNTDEGVVNGNGYRPTTENKEVELNAVELLLMVKSIEDEIEVLQEELDVHNATTEI